MKKTCLVSFSLIAALGVHFFYANDDRSGQPRQQLSDNQDLARTREGLINQLPEDKRNDPREIEKIDDQLKRIVDFAQQYQAREDERIAAERADALRRAEKERARKAKIAQENDENLEKTRRELINRLPEDKRNDLREIKKIDDQLKRIADFAKQTQGREDTKKVHERTIQGQRDLEWLERQRQQFIRELPEEERNNPERIEEINRRVARVAGFAR